MKTYLSIFPPLIVSGLFVTATHTFAQGSLTPPGASAPTMKSLGPIDSLILAETGFDGGKGCDPSSIVSKSAASSRGGIMPMSLTKPPVVSRTSWGCPDGQNSPLWPPQYTTVTHLIVHHSATANSSANWAAEVLSIWNYHTYTQGWGDIGYNYLIDPNGVIYEGRAGGDNVIGAHFSCQNGGTFGVCVLGTYTSVSPSAAALSSLKQLLAWKAEQRGIDPLGSTYHSGTHLTLSNICGHRDANPAYPQYACGTTDCPGDVLYGLLPSIRTDVYNLIHPNLLPDLTIVEPVVVSPTSVAPGGTIRVDWTEKNQGTAASTPAHHTKICLSTSAYGTTYQVGYYAMYTLGAAVTQSYYDPAIVVPASVPAGDYYVTAFIDCDQQVSESNENNNIGSSSPTRLTVTPTNISVTVQPSPSGLSFTVDGASYTSAQNFSWVPGPSHTIGAASPQSGGTGIQYVWSSWSDGGAQSHSITVPSSATTYTATFTVVTPVAISLVRNGSSLTLSWPTAATGWTLQNTSSLSNPAWQTVSGVVNNSVTLPAESGNLFFRLIH